MVKNWKFRGGKEGGWGAYMKFSACWGMNFLWKYTIVNFVQIPGLEKWSVNLNC